MTKLFPCTLFAAALLGVPCFAAAAATQSIPANPSLQEIVDGSWRTPAFVKRDRYRHPLQVLEFFGLKPDMTLIEIDAGGGWWTQMFAPYLKTHGHLVETIPPEGSTGFEARSREHLLGMLKSNPELYSKVTTVPFAPPKLARLGPPGSADMVFTSRNLHDLVNAHAAKAFMTAAFEVLKPGGILAVTDHRAWPSAEEPEVSRKFHRITEDYAIGLGLGAGFRLAGVSDVNANPRDPLNISVFKLPPTLADNTPAAKQKYEAIGESDVFVMKFVKP